MVVGEWVSRVLICNRFAMLLELERRCLTGQFSRQLYESVDRALMRECVSLVNIPGWTATA